MDNQQQHFREFDADLEDHNFAEDREGVEWLCVIAKNEKLSKC